MNFGHSELISREIFAYPYPGMSVKMMSGCTVAGLSRSSIKLIVRVLPGVELTCASFCPSSALIKLDLPTFERPKYAISGGPGGGKCSGAAADLRKRACSFMA